METLKLLSLTTMFAAFAGYTIFIFVKLGAQKSYSISYYELPRRMNYLFVLFTWLISLPLLTFSFNPTKPLFIIAAFNIAYVGGFARFTSNNFVATMHMIFAIGGMICAIVGLNIYYYCWQSVAITSFYIGVGALWSFLLPRVWIFTLEAMAFLTIITGLLVLAL